MPQPSCFRRRPPWYLLDREWVGPRSTVWKTDIYCFSFPGIEHPFLFYPIYIFVTKLIEVSGVQELVISLIFIIIFRCSDSGDCGSLPLVRIPALRSFI
jgi:hypothetical protein